MRRGIACMVIMAGAWLAGCTHENDCVYPLPAPRHRAQGHGMPPQSQPTEARVSPHAKPVPPSDP